MNAISLTNVFCKIHIGLILKKVVRGCKPKICPQNGRVLGLIIEYADELSKCPQVCQNSES